MTPTQIAALRSLAPNGALFDRHGRFHGTLGELRQHGLCDWSFVIPDAVVDNRTFLKAHGLTPRQLGRRYAFQRWWRLTDAGQAALDAAGRTTDAA